MCTPDSGIGFVLDVHVMAGAAVIFTLFCVIYEWLCVSPIYGALTRCYFGLCGVAAHGPIILSCRVAICTLVESELIMVINDFGRDNKHFDITVMWSDSSHIGDALVDHSGAQIRLGGSYPMKRTLQDLAVNLFWFCFAQPLYGRAQITSNYNFTSSNLFGPGYSSDNAGDGPLEQCTLCSTAVDLNDPPSLIRHMNHMHKGTSKVGCIASNGKQLYNCSVCAQVCLGTQGAKAHRTRAHAGEGEWTVDVVSTNESTAGIVEEPPSTSNGVASGVATTVEGTISTGRLESLLASTQGASQSEEVLMHIRRTYQGPIFRLHHSWKNDMATIATCLIRRAIAPNEFQAAISALLVFPGLITEWRFVERGTIQGILRVLAEAATLHPTRLADIIIGLGQRNLEKVVARRRQREVTESSSPRVGKLAARVDGLAREGRLKKATAILSDIRAVLNGEQTMREPRLTPSVMQTMCSELFPTANEDDDLTQLDASTMPSAAPLVITRDDVATCLDRLYVGSAAGASGWTNYLLRTLFIGNDEAIAAITHLFNLILEGQVDISCLNESRLVFIPKRSNGYRPLGIGDCWYRLLGRVVLKAIGADVGLHLLPMQLGVGVAGGCEIGARLPQVLTRLLPHHCVIALDVSNAFGTLRRLHIARGLAQYAPCLLPFFRRAYGGGSALVSSTGILVGSASTGVKQGDPLGSLLFCVGVHRMLLRIRAELQSIVVHSAVQGEPSGVISYMDDMTLYAPTSVTHLIVSQLPVIFAEYGLTMAAGKSKIYGGGLSVSNVGSIAVVNDGLVCLGTPTSLNVDFVVDHVRNSLEEATAPLSTLRHVKPWTALSILRFCVNQRAGYLARVVGDYAPVVRVLFQTFDEHIDNALFAIMGLVNVSRDNTVINTALQMRSLPLDLGGLGMMRHGGAAGAAACLQSREVLTKHLLEYYTDVLPQADVDWGGPAPILENAETPHVTLNPTSSTSARAIKHILREVHVKRFETIREGLCEGQEERKAAWLTSQAFKGSGAWLMGNAGFLQPPYAFSDVDEYIVALRMRLLISPFSAGDSGEDNRVVTCQACEQSIHQNSDFLHLVDCQLMQGYKSQRHKRVADLLAYHLTKVMGPLGSVGREPVVVGTKRADISFTDGITTVLLDVGICSPCNVLALQAGSHSEAGVAARIYATAKDTRYRQLLSMAAQPAQNTTPTPTQGITMETASPAPSGNAGVGTTEGARGGRPVWPIIWEATGRPGQDALAFLDSRFVRGHFSRLHLILALSQAVIMRYTARSIIAWVRMQSAGASSRAQNGQGDGPTAAPAGSGP